MEPITIIHHAGFDELIAPQGLYITEAEEPEIRTFSSRRTSPPGGGLAAWRTATTQEKEQYESQIREQSPNPESPVHP